MGFRESVGRWLPWLAAASSAVMAMTLLGSSLVWVLRRWFAVPYIDMVRIAEHFEHQGYGWFYRAVDHVLIGPMPFLIADDRWLGARGFSLVSLNLLCFLAFVGLICWPVKAQWRQSPALGVTLVALATGVFFWLGNYINWVWPVQIVLGLVLVCMGLATLALAEADRRLASGGQWPNPGQGSTAAAPLGIWALASFLGISCFGFGLLLFPAAIAVALTARWPRWPTAFVVTTSIVGIVAYWQVYDRSRLGVHGAAHWLARPWELLEYIVTFLAAVPHRMHRDFFLGGHLSPAPSGMAKALGVGVAGLLLLLLVLTALRRWRRGPTSNLETVGFVLGGMSLALVAMVAIPRFPLGAQQALSPRYVTPQMLIPVATVWLLAAHRGRREALAQRLLILAVPLVLSVLCLTQRGERIELMRASFQVEGVGMAALVGVEEPEHYAPIERASPELAMAVMQRFRQQGKSIFSAPWARRLGQVLIPPAGGLRACVGQVGKAEPVSVRGDVKGQGGVGATFRGWAFDRKARGAFVRMIAVDGDGIVRGFGATGGTRQDIAKTRGREWLPTAFKVYVDGTPGGDWQVFGERSDGTVCALGPPGG